MEKYYGTWEELKALVEAQGLKGTWKETANFKQFRSSFGGIINWYPSTCTISFQGPSEAKQKLEALLSGAADPTVARDATEAPVPQDRGGASKKIFIVHGHDTQAREQLELVLHRLEVQPFVLANTAGGGLTLIEALEQEIGPGPGRSRFGIVLLTPDDVGYAKRDGQDAARDRARQNVVLEMGMLMAALGRSNVAILRKGQLEIPSDASGIMYVPFQAHVREAVPKLVDRLQSAGFQLKGSAIALASS